MEILNGKLLTQRCESPIRYQKVYYLFLYMERSLSPLHDWVTGTITFLRCHLSKRPAHSL